MNSAEASFRLRQQFGDKEFFRDNDFDEEPINDNYASYGDFQLVGYGKATNDNCGKFKCFYGCPRVELHNRTTLDGDSHKDEVYVRPIFNSCDKASCPICYKHGWGVRQAGKIEGRLKEASKRFGQVEHIVATVPPKFYGLPFKDLRAKIIRVLKRRGVIGGCLIFHGFRYNLRKSWYWSPHFHCLGFILGGYPCRSCKKKCFKGCGGFVDRQYRAYEKDGCIARVLGKRITVGGTAWYQLNHASIKKGVVRFHVATWFGVCSYRKLKVTVEYKRHICPICQHDLVRMRYNGVNRFVSDFYGLTKDLCPLREFFANVKEDGRKVWFADECDYG